MTSMGEGCRSLFIFIIHIIAQANAPLTEDSHFAEARVLVRRRGGEVEYIPAEEVDYMDVSPRQMVSVATAMIPFLEHDDANRALMGANMMRQAVPLLRSEAPLVGTGMEYRAAVDAGDVVTAVRSGVVTEVASDRVVVKSEDGKGYDDITVAVPGTDPSDLVEILNSIGGVEVLSVIPVN